MYIHSRESQTQTLTLSARQASKCWVTATSCGHEYDQGRDDGHHRGDGHGYDYGLNCGRGCDSCGYGHGYDCDFGDGGDDGPGFDFEKTIVSWSFSTRNEFENEK